MVIEALKLQGLCSCSMDHELTTRMVVCQSNCLCDFESYMADIEGKRCVIYDENTYDATSGYSIKSDQIIILEARNLHANEVSTAYVLEKLQSDIKVIISVGGGTIHDIGRYCSYQRGCTFISVPTCASVDGFCSSVAAMTWMGFKKTFTACAPSLVIADLFVISKAPIALALSGVGDILAKYTALADWRISHLLTGEHFCTKIHDLMFSCIQETIDSSVGLLQQSPSSYEKLMGALCLSGLCMQMETNSRPASGAEHHISHLIEVHPAMLEVGFEALHGEKTGVGTVVASGVYHELGQIENIEPYIKGYNQRSEEQIMAFFGPKIAGAFVKENNKDCLGLVSRQNLIEKWQDIRGIINTIPSSESISNILQNIKAKTTLEDIGVKQSDLETLLHWSPYVRNRLTLMRIRGLLGL